MSNDLQEREVPEDQDRVQIKVFEPIREYLKQRTEETGMTYSEQLREWLPDDVENIEFAQEEDETVVLKAAPDLWSAVDQLAGTRVSKGEVIGLYVLRAAMRNGDEEVVEELTEQARFVTAEAKLKHEDRT